MKYKEIRDARNKVLLENEQVIELKATLAFFRFRIKEIENIIYGIEKDIIFSEEYFDATEEDCKQMKRGSQ